MQLNSVIAITQLIRFDEHENATGLGSSLICSPCAPSNVSLPEASRRSSASSPLFPALGTTDLGGWMYMNLSSGSQHVTSGGLVGKVTKVVDDDQIEFEISDGVRVRQMRQMISGVRAKGEPAKEKSEAKDKDESSAS